VSILRKDLPAEEVEALHKRLGLLLDQAGVETQPKVATRLLALAQDSNAQIRDYHDTLKTDWALTGRILRLANSAAYAQRQPVTRLERALIILGIERTKAVALGFYLSRAVAGACARAMSRKVWGESVYRAALAQSMAKSACPHLAPEAFIVGLMLDCGQPLMARLIGETYECMYTEQRNPARLAVTEAETFEYTHVDLVTVLVERWKLPAVLAKPISLHHTAPQVGRSVDSITLLHRLGYYVGAVQLDAEDSTPTAKAPMSTIAERLFDILPAELETVVKSTRQSYQELMGIFSGIGDEIEDLDALSDFVASQLSEIMDGQMERAVAAESRGGAERLHVCGQAVEVEPGRNGEVVAYINSSEGQRVVSCTVNPKHETPDSVGRMLGLEDATTGELLELMRVMQQMAA